MCVCVCMYAYVHNDTSVCYYGRWLPMVYS